MDQLLSSELSKHPEDWEIKIYRNEDRFYNPKMFYKGEYYLITDFYSIQAKTMDDAYLRAVEYLSYCYDFSYRRGCPTTYVDVLDN